METHRVTLTKMASLAELGDEAVGWLAATVEPRAFAPGEVLIKQGDATRECYFVVAGKTEVRRDGSVLGVSGEGEPEGELGLFLRSRRAATTTALTPVSALVLGPDAWDRLCEQNPALADEIRVGICRHLARRFGLPSFAGVPIE